MIADDLRGLDEHFVESLRYLYYWKVKKYTSYAEQRG